MIKNELRIGSATSSEIVALTTRDTSGKKPGAPFLTLVEEINMERRLGRSITDEISAKPLTWGKLGEKLAFDLLGMEYILLSTDTVQHPTIPYWAGSKDGIKYDEGKTVIDLKCPFTLKSFCKLVQPLYDGLEGMDVMNALRFGYSLNGTTYKKHADGEKYFWQLVSNAILDDCKFAELIVYMPYESEIPDIKLAADGFPNAYFIAMAIDGELPFIPDGGYYNNLNVIRFEVPQADKDFLTQSVELAGTMLIDWPNK